MRCRHVWVPSKLGKFEKCSVCGTRFPCASSCTHFDCMLERGESLPDWVVMPVEEMS